MPTSTHEALVEVFRERPSFATDLLQDRLHIGLPRYRQIRLEPADLNDLQPTEYRADSVMTLADGDPDQPAFAVVIEVQLSQDDRKRWSWPVYVATLRARKRCPVALLVVCPDDTVAKWCKERIALGPPDSQVCPLVIGPDELLDVPSKEWAMRNPEHAILSAASGYADLDILKEAFEELQDRERALKYAEILAAALPKGPRRSYWEKLMTATFKFRSDLAKRFIAEGEAKLVLRVLERRGIEVPKDIRTRITECKDTDQLETWHDRAITANSIQDLFD